LGRIVRPRVARAGTSASGADDRNLADLGEPVGQHAQTGSVDAVIIADQDSHAFLVLRATRRTRANEQDASARVILETTNCSGFDVTSRCERRSPSPALRERVA
jgi:hypothetical protein